MSKIMIICFSGLILTANASSNSSDSLTITKIVNNFYEWYLAEIATPGSSAYKPKFVEDSKGMTTLDCSEYVQCLKKFRFSDFLISKELQSYQKCIGNLSRIKFADFKNTVFVDFDEFENADCDFGNSFRWCCGQEPNDHLEIARIAFGGNNSALVQLQHLSVDSETLQKKHWGNVIVSLVRMKDGWYINDISLSE